MELGERILKAKKYIRECQEEESQLVGMIKTLQEQLKTTFKASTEKQAQTKLEKLQAQIPKLKTKLEKDLEKLESFLEEA